MEAGNNKKTATIYQKLQQLQAEIKVPKTEAGRFGKHRNVEGILEALKPALKKYELALTLNNKVVEAGGRTYINAIATIYDSQGNMLRVSAQAWEGELSRGLDSAQITGSASSYARKYALAGLFAIDDTKDPDSHKDAPDPAAELQTKPPVVVKPKPQKDTDPATPQQKHQLKNMMTASSMEADAMSLMVETVLEKPTVDTFGDFKKVVAAMEEK